MKKIEQFDRNYRERGSSLSIRERINYCAMIIYRTHRYLSRYGSRLSSFARNRSHSIIASAETELTRLISNTD